MMAAYHRIPWNNIHASSRGQTWVQDVAVQGALNMMREIIHCKRLPERFPLPHCARAKAMAWGLAKSSRGGQQDLKMSQSATARREGAFAKWQRIETWVAWFIASKAKASPWRAHGCAIEACQLETWVPAASAGRATHVACTYYGAQQRWAPRAKTWRTCWTCRQPRVQLAHRQWFEDFAGGAALHLARTPRRAVVWLPERSEELGARRSHNRRV